MLVHHFARGLVARGHGGILLVSSVGGLSGVPYVTDTAAVEAYVLTLGEGPHDELAREHVRAGEEDRRDSSELRSWSSTGRIMDSRPFGRRSRPAKGEMLRKG